MLLTKEELKIIQQLEEFQATHSESYKQNTLSPRSKQLYDLACYLVAAEYASGISDGDAPWNQSKLNHKQTITQIRALLPKALELMKNID